MTGPYEPKIFDSDGKLIPHEERDWPETPPGEREVRWAYYITRERERTLRIAHETRHDAIGAATKFNIHMDTEPFHVVAHQTNGPMYWDTGEETVCDWCGFTTTIRPINGWSFVLDDDNGDGGRSFCTSECHARWAKAEGREEFPNKVVPSGESSLLAVGPRFSPPRGVRGRTNASAQRASMEETTTTAAAETAFGAYREANTLIPAESLSYEEARKHDNGDTLADFLVIELTEGVDNKESPAAQYDRGIALLERAIRDLSHVQTELEVRREQLQTNQNDA